MARNAVLGVIVGLMVGLVVGYVLGERQAVPPAAAVGPAMGGQSALPEGHPPVPGASGTGEVDRRLQQQVAEIEGLLAENPGDARLMVALGDAYYDAQRWEQARTWYERSIAQDGGDSNVLTDLAVVYRSLGNPERSLELLSRALALDADHWQAQYNTVVVLHFDLHRHDEAVAALERLEAMKAANAAIPDLTSLASQVRGS